jgi:hypothetical protein
VLPTPASAALQSQTSLAGCWQPGIGVEALDPPPAPAQRRASLLLQLCLLNSLQIMLLNSRAAPSAPRAGRHFTTFLLQAAESLVMAGHERHRVVKCWQSHLLIAGPVSVAAAARAWHMLTILWTPLRASIDGGGVLRAATRSRRLQLFSGSEGVGWPADGAADRQVAASRLLGR